MVARYYKSRGQGTPKVLPSLSETRNVQVASFNRTYRGHGHSTLNSSREKTDKNCSHLLPPALWWSSGVSHWLIPQKRSKTEDGGSRFTLLGHRAGQGRLQHRFEVEATFVPLKSFFVLWFHVYIHSCIILCTAFYTLGHMEKWSL